MSSTDLWTTRAVASFIFILLSLLVMVLCFVTVPKENHDIVITLVGAITGSVVTIVAFYFGSSSSSKDKDATIKEMKSAE